MLGFILGVTSVGSGALIGLALILIFRLTPHRVVGTDVFHAAVLLWAAGLAHVIAGNVDYGLMGNILSARSPASLIGERLARSVPGGRAASRARLRDARLGARRRVEGRARPAGGGDHRAAARGRGVRLRRSPARARRARAAARSSAQPA